MGGTILANLKTLAQTLGLSITTVSRALDGYSDVSEKTRERVRAAADAAGYRPNAAARRLRRQRAEVVALMLPTDPGHFGPPVFLAMLGACAERLAADGLSLMIAPVARGQSELDLCRRLVDGGRVEALILVRTKRDDERVAFLQDRGIPFVTHGRTRSPTPHAFVDGDGREAFARATSLFAADGHSRIALISAPGEYNFAHERRCGWQEAMSALHLPTDLLEETPPTEQGGFDAALRLLARPQAPTAILCATDEMAVGALRALRCQPAGRDICLIGHDDLPTGAFTDPPLTTMRMAGDAVGDILAASLLGALAGEPAEKHQTMLPVEFVLRESHWRRNEPASASAFAGISEPRPSTEEDPR